MWHARLFSVALLFFMRFLGLPTILWMLIPPAHWTVGSGGLGLRLFQSSNWEGLPFPLPPSLGCGSRGSRGGIGSIFSTTWDSPNRYHKLFRPQNDPVLGFQTGLKTRSHFGSNFFSSFSRFSGFIQVCFAQTAALGGFCGRDELQVKKLMD